MLLTRRAWLAALALPALPAPAFALAPPVGEVLLRVRGDIAVTNRDGEAWLDRAALEGMGRVDLRTGTPWSAGEETFTGVPAARLLDRLGARGSIARALALNDYKVDIPVAELRSYPVLLALERGGRPLRVRELGPIWIVYPWSQFPDLDDRVHRQRSVWQLDALELR